MAQEPAPSVGGNPFFDGIVRSTQDQPAVENLAKAVQPFVKRALKRNRRLKNALHGTWLGHPLHPVLTDIPIGAWTMAAIFDVLTILGADEMAPAADVSVAVGITGALAAALSGLADWSQTDGRPARVGAVHATCNSIAISAYVVSLFARRRSRAAGIFASFAGLGIVTIGAGLGGHLVYGENQGVNHAAAEDLPVEFIRLLPLEELMENKPHRANLNGRNIALIRRGADIYVLLDSCSHLGGPLSEGQVEDGSIRCPWHGSRFSLENGRVLDGPATLNQPTLQARVVDGYVEVRAFEPEAP